MLAPIDDGVIKYSSQLRPGPCRSWPGLEALNLARTELFDLGLIGAYPSGLGYGNLSLRVQGEQFVITGSATGSQRVLELAQYVCVEAFSVEANWVRAVGAIDASSESLTHGAIYQSNAQVHCVIHVHSRRLFDTFMHTESALTTPPDVAYGTPAMAQSVAQLVRAQSRSPVLFAMLGHDEGLVAFGADVTSVAALLVNALERSFAP